MATFNSVLGFKLAHSKNLQLCTFNLKLSRAGNLLFVDRIALGHQLICQHGFDFFD